MNTAATFEIAPRFWSEEPSKRPGRRRIRAHIGGLHCSLCTSTIEKALGRRPGVDKVTVSLFGPAVVWVAGLFGAPRVSRRRDRCLWPPAVRDPQAPGRAARATTNAGSSSREQG